MIPNTISKRVLTMGVDYHNPKGGIAQVLYAYSQIFETFRFIPTTNSKNFFSRQMTGIIAALKLLSLLLRKEIKIVHIHCASGKSFYRKSLYIFICQFFNVKILCHMHSGHFVTLFINAPILFEKHSFDAIQLSYWVIHGKTSTKILAVSISILSTT